MGRDGTGQGKAESKLETDLKSICRELGSGPGVLAGSMCNPSLGTVSSSSVSTADVSRPERSWVPVVKPTAKTSEKGAECLRAHVRTCPGRIHTHTQAHTHPAPRPLPAQVRTCTPTKVHTELSPQPDTDRCWCTLRESACTGLGCAPTDTFSGEFQSKFLNPHPIPHPQDCSVTLGCPSTSLNFCICSYKV